MSHNGPGHQQDIQALAKGGQTNVLGFMLRLLARIPFLIIASRFYGAESLGRFASALVMVELAAQLCTLGQKRGLAQRLSQDCEHPANSIADAMLLTALLAIPASVALYLFPQAMYPTGNFSEADRLLVVSILPLALTDIALAALAYRYDVASTVRSRAIVEPWTLSITAGIFFFLIPASGLQLAFVASITAVAAMLVASDEATSGSVMKNTERMSPASRGLSPFSFCSALPYFHSTSMLQESGALQLKISGAIIERPVSSALKA